MSTSPDLGFPFIEQQQTEPEATHNDALVVISALLKGVISSGGNTPPGSPTAGDAYIVGTAPTGVWAGKANTIAIYYNGAWKFVPGFDNSGSQITPGARQEGMVVYDQAINGLQVWTGSAWVARYLLEAAKQTAVADATGGVIVDAEARTALNDLLAKCRTLGLIAT
jgi:hypothetical protein